MFARPKPSARSGRYSKVQAGTKPQSNRGSFVNSVWHCDCEPKLPAEHFQVKKQGKNKGRWFYTCQKEPKQRCKFFLWGEEAMLREKETVLSNSRTEPPQKKVKSRGIFGGLSMSDELELAQSMPGFDEDDTESEAEEVNTPSKLRSFDLTSERYGISAQNEELHEKLHRHTSPVNPQPRVMNDDRPRAFETPKMDRISTAYVTPAPTTDRKRVLPWNMSETTMNNKISAEEQLETPSKRIRLDENPIFNSDDMALPCIYRGVPITSSGNGTTATADRPNLDHMSNAIAAQQIRPTTPAKNNAVALPAAPAPIRFKDAMPPSAAVSLMDLIEKELASSQVPEAVMKKVREHIAKHERIARGTQKARDTLREQNKKYKEQIASLLKQRGN